MKNIFILLALIVVGSISLNAQAKKKPAAKKPTTTIFTPSTTIVLPGQTKTENTSSNSGSTSGSSSNTNSDPIGGIVNTIGGLLGSVTGQSSGGGMTQELAAKGLKEALNFGTGAASSKLGAVDGFLANAAVKILMPPEAKKMESTLRSVGMGQVCDQVIVSVNHAAESAVVEAKPIFLAAITQMTLTDAINILTGGPTAATDYLKRTSGQALMAKFEPIIQTNLQKTNATKYWSDAMTAYNAVPFTKKVNPNLSQYVTQRATEGIFLMVSEEEQKIRANPIGSISSVIRDVFGWAKNQK